MSHRVCFLACPVYVRHEVWLPITVPVASRWDHRYEVSSQGKVRNANTGRVLAQRTHARGYAVVTLARDPGTTYVHRLVALAFLGPPPRDELGPYEVDHLDFDRMHNTVNNLRWLPKNTNAWRWRIWADEEPPEWRELPPPTPSEHAAWLARLKDNGWPEPPAHTPRDIHRHIPEGATA